ncbi:two-component system response regulator [Rhizobium sp. R339]|nr:two-component system response regulator [Rhizobium sp. R339]
MDDLIKNFGYQSRLFSSAEEFLDFEPRAEIDCMLVDVKMPGLTGLELLAELNRRGDRPPMIFVTSYDDERTRKAALNGGAFAFLRKPVDVSTLIGCLEAAFSQRP